VRLCCVDKSPPETSDETHSGIRTHGPPQVISSTAEIKATIRDASQIFDKHQGGWGLYPSVGSVALAPQLVHKGWRQCLRCRTSRFCFLL
jgi:hypothetical protein